VPAPVCTCSCESACAYACACPRASRPLPAHISPGPAGASPPCARTGRLRHPSRPQLAAGRRPEIPFPPELGWRIRGLGPGGAAAYSGVTGGLGPGVPGGLGLLGARPNAGHGQSGRREADRPARGRRPGSVVGHGECQPAEEARLRIRLDAKSVDRRCDTGSPAAVSIPTPRCANRDNQTMHAK
jgi:hypothetical protein